MKKTIFAAVLAAAVILSGCGQKTASDKSADTYEEVTTAPPMGDFVDDVSYYTGTFNGEVFKHIIGNISINGERVSMPCSFAELPAGVTPDRCAYIDKEHSVAVYSFLFNGRNAGLVEYELDRELTEDEIKTMPFYSLSLEYHPLISCDIGAAGLKLKDTYDMMIANLGEPTKSKVDEDGDGSAEYSTDEFGEVNFYFKNNKINSIFIITDQKG